MGLRQMQQCTLHIAQLDMLILARRRGKDTIRHQIVPLAFEARAAHLAKGPTAAYGRVKEAIRGSFGNDLEQQLALEAKLQGQCGKTRDFKEGVVAFLEKRPAQYEGR